MPRKNKIIVWQEKLTNQAQNIPEINAVLREYDRSPFSTWKHVVLMAACQETFPSYEDFPKLAKRVELTVAQVRGWINSVKGKEKGDRIQSLNFDSLDLIAPFETNKQREERLKMVPKEGKAAGPDEEIQIILYSVFKINSHPTPEEFDGLSRETGMSTDSLYFWFNNRRNWNDDYTKWWNLGSSLIGAGKKDEKTNTRDKFHPLQKFLLQQARTVHRDHLPGDVITKLMETTKLTSKQIKAWFNHEKIAKAPFLSAKQSRLEQLPEFIQWTYWPKPHIENKLKTLAEKIKKAPKTGRGRKRKIREQVSSGEEIEEEEDDERNIRQQPRKRRNQKKAAYTEPSDDEMETDDLPLHRPRTADNNCTSSEASRRASEEQSQSLAELLKEAIAFSENWTREMKKAMDKAKREKTKVDHQEGSSTMYRDDDIDMDDNSGRAMMDDDVDYRPSRGEDLDMPGPTTRRRLRTRSRRLSTATGPSDGTGVVGSETSTARGSRASCISSSRQLVDSSEGSEVTGNGMDDGLGEASMDDFDYTPSHREDLDMTGATTPPQPMDAREESEGADAKVATVDGDLSGSKVKISGASSTCSTASGTSLVSLPKIARSENGMDQTPSAPTSRESRAVSCQSLTGGSEVSSAIDDPLDPVGGNNADISRAPSCRSLIGGPKSTTVAVGTSFSDDQPQSPMAPQEDLASSTKPSCQSLTASEESEAITAVSSTEEPVKLQEVTQSAPVEHQDPTCGETDASTPSMSSHQLLSANEDPQATNPVPPSANPPALVQSMDAMELDYTTLSETYHLNLDVAKDTSALPSQALDAPDGPNVTDAVLSSEAEPESAHHNAPTDAMEIDHTEPSDAFREDLDHLNRGVPEMAKSVLSSETLAKPAATPTNATLNDMEIDHIEPSDAIDDTTRDEGTPVVMTTPQLSNELDNQSSTTSGPETPRRSSDTDASFSAVQQANVVTHGSDGVTSEQSAIREDQGKQVQLPVRPTIPPPAATLVGDSPKLPLLRQLIMNGEQAYQGSVEATSEPNGTKASSRRTVDLAHRKKRASSMKLVGKPSSVGPYLAQDAHTAASQDLRAHTTPPTPSSPYTPLPTQRTPTVGTPPSKFVAKSLQEQNEAARRLKVMRAENGQSADNLDPRMSVGEALAIMNQQEDTPTSSEQAHTQQPPKIHSAQGDQATTSSMINALARNVSVQDQSAHLAQMHVSGSSYEANGQSPSAGSSDHRHLLILGQSYQQPNHFPIVPSQSFGLFGLPEGAVGQSFPAGPLDHRQLSIIFQAQGRMAAQTSSSSQHQSYQQPNQPSVVPTESLGSFAPQGLHGAVGQSFPTGSHFHQGQIIPYCMMSAPIITTSHGQDHLRPPAIPHGGLIATSSSMNASGPSDHLGISQTSTFMQNYLPVAQSEVTEQNRAVPLPPAAPTLTTVKEEASSDADPSDLCDPKEEVLSRPDTPDEDQYEHDYRTYSPLGPIDFSDGRSLEEMDAAEEVKECDTLDEQTLIHEDYFQQWNVERTLQFLEKTLGVFDGIKNLSNLHGQVLWNHFERKVVPSQNLSDFGFTAYQITKVEKALTDLALKFQKDMDRHAQSLTRDQRQQKRRSGE